MHIPGCPMAHREIQIASNDYAVTEVGQAIPIYSGRENRLRLTWTLRGTVNGRRTRVRVKASLMAR